MFDNFFTQKNQISENTNNYKTEQDKWITAYNIKPGTIVQVLRHAFSGEQNWGASWHKDMDFTIGEYAEVDYGFNCGKSGIRLKFKGIDWTPVYPYFVLAIVD